MSSGDEYSLIVGIENSLVGAAAASSGTRPKLAAFAPVSIVRPDLYGTGAALVVQLRELLMILDLHRQGLSVSAIARRTGRDPKTVRKYIERGLELPAMGRDRWGGQTRSRPLSTICANGS